MNSELVVLFSLVLVLVLVSLSYSSLLHSHAFLTCNLTSSNHSHADPFFPPHLVSIAGAFCVWISSPEAAFLKGRFVWAQWDVEEMKARKQEILDNPNLLSLSLGGWPFEGPAEKVLG